MIYISDIESIYFLWHTVHNEVGHWTTQMRFEISSYKVSTNHKNNYIRVFAPNLIGRKEYISIYIVEENISEIIFPQQE